VILFIAISMFPKLMNCVISSKIFRGAKASQTRLSSNLPVIQDLRKEYSRIGLSENDSLIKSGKPIDLFALWLQEACSANVIEPNAMCLSTCKNNRPSARFVLLKAFDDRGFVWYTNYESRKSEELSENPFGALTFWWGDLERSVRIEGRVVKVSEQESSEYFSSRPRTSQIGAWSSNQSRTIASREALELQEQEVNSRFDSKNNTPIEEGTSLISAPVVPRPPHWGGFRLVPDRIEFWKGRESRLHDRIVFLRDENNNSTAWQSMRLQP